MVQMLTSGSNQLLRRGITFAVTALLLVGGAAAPALAQTLEESSDGIELVAQDDVKHEGTWGTCPWQIDSLGTLRIFPGKGASQEGKTQSPWDEYAREINEIAFVAQDGASVELNGSVSYLFSQLYKVKSIDFSGAVMTEVTDMSYMFYECEALTSLDLTKFENTSVIYMNDMFHGCASLETVELSSWRTLQLRTMRNMFAGCGHLKFAAISGFDTQNVTDMSGMFSNCTWLSVVDLAGLNTWSCTDMSNMFRGCTSLKHAELNSFNTTNCVNMNSMFSGCVSLPTVDLGGFHTGNVTDMEYMFRGCDSLSELDVSDFDTSKVTVMDGMFNGAGMTSLDLSGFDVSGVEDLSYLFYKCTELETLDVSGWDTSGVKYFNSMFGDCDSLETLDITDWDSAGCEEATDMFKGATGLQSFTVGETFIIPTDADTFPNPTATNGKWWSTTEHAWYTKDQILEARATVGDTYTSIVDEEFQTDIADADIALDQKVFAWTGKEINPVPTVTLNGLTLSEGVDYEVAYFQNVEIGKAAISITGIGAYKGIAVESFEIVRSSKFIDVTDATPHVEDIDWLDINAISSGWYVGGGEYEFRPYAQVARADMAAFLFRAARMIGLVDDSWTPTISQSQAFVDVEYETPHSREIRWLASVGISQGWKVKDSDQYEFRPYAPVARQDMAAFLFRMAKLTNMAGATDEWTASEKAMTRFADVDPNSETNHHREVWWLAESGVSEGWAMPDGTYQFRGLSNIARCDIAAFLHRLSLLVHN